MPEGDPWEAYFYPETIDAMGQGTLHSSSGASRRPSRG